MHGHEVVQRQDDIGKGWKRTLLSIFLSQIFSKCGLNLDIDTWFLCLSLEPMSMSLIQRLILVVPLQGLTLRAEEETERW